MVQGNEQKHEIRNAILALEANKLKILKLVQQVLEILKDNDKQLKRIEEALKDGK